MRQQRKYMAENNNRIVIELQDDPQAKLGFLDATMRGQEWSATVRTTEKSADAKDTLTSLQKTLHSEGYATRLTTDKAGGHALEVTRFGAESKFRDISHAKGTGAALHHTVQNLGSTLAKPFGKLIEIGKFWTENKAKLIGMTYLLGDLILASAGLQKDENAKSSGKSRLQRTKEFFTAKEKRPSSFRFLYGMLGALQSLIFMNFASESDQQLARNMSRQMKEASRHGADLTNIGEWAATPPKVNPIIRFLERHAIPVGSVTQMIGRGFWLAAGLIDQKDNKDELKKAGLSDLTESEWENRQKRFDNNEYQGQGREEMFDALQWHSEAVSGASKIKDSILSMLGWIFIMTKEPSTQPGKESSGLMHFIRKNSNRIASFLNGGSTAFGFHSAHKKIGLKVSKHMTEKEKKIIEEGRRVGDMEMLGNTAYLLGDATVFLTKSVDYDEKSANHPAKLAKVGIGILEKIPVAMGNEKKNAVMSDIANHLARHTEILKTGSQTMDDEAKERIAAHARSIRSEMINLMPDQTHLLEEISAAAAGISSRFPQQHQEQVISAIAAVLAKTPSIEAPEQEIRQLIADYSAEKNLNPENLPAETGVVYDAIATLVKTIPGADKAASAAAFYDAVTPALRAASEEAGSTEITQPNMRENPSLQAEHKPTTISAAEETSRWRDGVNTPVEAAPAMAF